MKHCYFVTMAIALLLMAGCDSETSAVCKDGELKADCDNGKYTKCVDGQWAEATCEGGASCTSDGSCGECKDGDVQDTCNDGNFATCTNGEWKPTACPDDASCAADGKCGECKDGEEKACYEGNVTKCVKGAWTQTTCEGDVSCTAEGKCGECKDGDSKQCTNGLKNAGKAIMCKNGKWDAEPSYCPEQFSCSMSNECYQCLSKCDKDPCPADCTDSECEELCNLYADCKAKCNNKYNGCESKCGSCVNGDNINCTENDGVGSADFCINGKWSNYDCGTIHGVSGLNAVSCTKKCLIVCGDTTCCKEDEYISICGECLNQKDPICVKEFDDVYGLFYPKLTNKYQLVTCEKGKLQVDGKGYTPCNSECFSQAGRDACLQTVPQGSSNN